MRFFELLRVPVALLLAAMVAALSCEGVTAYAGEGVRASGSIAVVRTAAPYLVGLLSGGWVFYMIVADARRARRRRNRAARVRLPAPATAAAICIAVVFAIVGIRAWRGWGLLGPDWDTLFVALLIVWGLVVGVPLSLLVALAMSIERKRLRQDAETDQRAPNGDVVSS